VLEDVDSIQPDGILSIYYMSTVGVVRIGPEQPRRNSKRRLSTMHASIALTLALRMAWKVTALGDSTAVGRGNTVLASAGCSSTQERCKLLISKHIGSEDVQAL
jgi:hypothetical protein